MRRTVDDWLLVVDRSGRLGFAASMLLAVLVSLVEILGAGAVAAALQLVTEARGSAITLPGIGDLEARLPGSDRVADLRWLALAATGLFVVRGVLAFIQLSALYRASFGLGVRLTDRTSAVILDQPYAWHLGKNPADLATTVNVVTRQFVTSVFTPIQAACTYLLVIVALAAVAVATDPVGTLVAGAALVLVIVVSVRTTRRRLVKYGQVEVEEVAHSQRLATETLTAVREVKLLDLSRPLRGQLKRSRMRWAHAMRRRSALIGLPRLVIETIAFSGLIVFFAVRGRTGPDALTSAGVLGYAVARVLPTANSLILSINTARGNVAALRSTAGILRLPTSTPGDRPLDDEHPVLEARGVRYQYPEGHEVLRGFDLVLRPGSSVGLVGSTGSGKTTLLDVLTGLLDPTAGEVLVGGVPLAECRAAWWERLGIVPQTMTLLDASVAENIAMGEDPDRIDDDRLQRAIRLAQLEDVVAGMENGVRTTIGARGVRLSGGQRQRLAIARALYRDPPVVILDEGTSALDSDTERAVIEALREGREDRTLLMVAHRVATLRSCDEILLLEDGRVAARGTYDALRKGSAAFRRLAGVSEGRPRSPA